MIKVRMDNLHANVHLGSDDGAIDSRMALDRRDDWSGVGEQRWSPWGTTFCDIGADHTGGDEAVLGPITLSDYDADRRWKLRDKCLRVATFTYLLLCDAYV